MIVSGKSNLKLAQALAKETGLKLGRILIERFSDGEIYVRVQENIKGKEVFVLQSLHYPAGEKLMELLIMVDALKEMAPKKITAILPFYAYRRQERKSKEGESATAALVARLLEAAGITAAVLVDIHSEKILDFFKVPVINIETAALFADYFKKLKLKNAVVVAPDLGALGDAQNFAQRLNLTATYIVKKRRAHDAIGSMELFGEVAGRNVIIIDDEIDTAGTILEAACLLKAKGAKDIYVCATHAVFSGPAITRLKKAPVKQIIVTDTISLSSEKIKALDKKLKIISVAPLVAGSVKI